ncbi:MAG: ATP-binding protein [Dissulfurispiraceae bacterium]
MPFNTVPIKDFVNRENELNYLRRFSDLRGRTMAGNILLEGTRGIGKTELIKQTFRIIFWGDKNIAPFYYLFQRGILKASYFAKDYFTRFVRQYLAYLKKDPTFIDGMGTSLTRLFPLIASLRVEWMIDLIEDFQDHVKNDDPYGQVLAAISAPVSAAGKSGRPVFIMLDDFHMAAQLYETSPGDSPGLIGLFESSMRNYLCPHVLTGSPEGILESIFTDNSFRGMAERMFLGQLPEDAAYALFKRYCDDLQITCDKETMLKFVRILGGNPLYIRNIVRAIWKMEKRNITDLDIWEIYSFEISGGETAFYWSSILGEFIRDAGQRRIAAQLFMHLIKSDSEFHDTGRLAKILAVPEASVRSVLESLQMAGIIQGVANIRHLKDNVLQDFMQSLYLREVEGVRLRQIQELIEARYSSISAAAAPSYEMVIPMTSNAELVAAKAVEQIGKNMNIAPDVIKHIQLALIETCLNAIEHSGSYDKKVTLKFTTLAERLEIMIECPGKFFDIENIEEVAVEEKLRSEHKRGWGMKLIRTIMDEVRIERIEDRTRIVLIKNIKPSEVLR